MSAQASEGSAHAIVTTGTTSWAVDDGVAPTVALRDEKSLVATRPGHLIRSTHPKLFDAQRIQVLKERYGPLSRVSKD